jgi:hypothetical protein
MAARITGAKELIRDLKSLGVSVEDLKAPFNAVADKAAHLAASYAPKRTGRLATSVKGSRTKNRASVRAGSKRVPYAGAINYGWPRRNIQGAHFMQRASDAMLPIAEKEIRAELDKLIRDRNLS